MSAATHAQVPAAPALPGTWRIAPVSDPSVQILLDDLVREYHERYGSSLGGAPHSARAEVERYPAERFEAPHGTFLIYEEDGEPLTGGALMRYDEATAEVKRVWTRADQRGRRLAAATMTHLEERARELGYTRIYLTTGPAQPEAVALYLRAGYTPGFDPAQYPTRQVPHPFSKDLLTPDPGADRAEHPIDPRAVAATPASHKEQIA
jgi:GNAT superfamily N-acetyltransferase